MFGLVPFRNLNLPSRDIFNQFMRGFFDDDFWAPFGSIGNAVRIDLRETANEYILEADLPGVRKGDITLHYENQYLTIYAHRDDITEVKNDNYVCRERRSGQFQRSIFIDNVIDDQISAKFDDGVLTVTLPKRNKTIKRQGNIPIY